MIQPRLRTFCPSGGIQGKVAALQRQFRGKDLKRCIQEPAFRLAQVSTVLMHRAQEQALSNKFVNLIHSTHEMSLALVCSLEQGR